MSNPIIWIVMFLALFLFGIWSQKLESSEYSHQEMSYLLPNSQAEISHLRRLIDLAGNYPLSPADRKFYEDKVRFHLSNGQRCYNDAKQICWYLPNLNDRDKAQYCFDAAAAAMLPGTPISKMISVIIATLVKYGLDAIDQWHELHNKLYWAHYHYDMAEFYQDVLNQG